MDENKKIVYISVMKYNNETRCVNVFDSYDKAEKFMREIAPIFLEEAIALKLPRPHFFIEVRSVL